MKEKVQRLKIGKIDNTLLLLDLLIVGIYTSWWFWPGNRGAGVLFGLLFAGEIYHILMAITFWLTIRNLGYIEKYRPPKHREIWPSVDIFITVAGEPVEIVRRTVAATKKMDYPNHNVYILNDGKALNKENWKEIEEMAVSENVNCVTRDNNKGAKAGNVNNGMRESRGEIIVILDADMVVKKKFLSTIIPYFENPKVGFVQTPQYYRNWRKNEITQGSWEQQKFFFGPVMEGKDQDNAAFICGTNFAIRRKALEEVGGMVEDNIAEDFLTSMKVHQKGWRSVYLREVLAWGLAPEDLLSYSKQQLRWARGSLEVMFGQNPFLKRGLSWKQRVHYLASAMYYLNGLVVLIDISLPAIFLWTGIKPVVGSSTSFALVFMPFIFTTLYTLHLASGGEISFRAMAFSQSSFVIQLKALWSILTGQKMGFAVTSKTQLEGNFINLAYPHILYVLISITGVGVALYREGPSASVATNTAWATFNSLMFLPFIGAAARKNKATEFAEVKKEVAVNETN